MILLIDEIVMLLTNETIYLFTCLQVDDYLFLGNLFLFTNGNGDSFTDEIAYILNCLHVYLLCLLLRYYLITFISTYLVLHHGS